MNTIPLFSTLSVASGSHRVTAPGGYEWWHFDAEDLATQTLITADLFDGHPFHPQYLRRYARYRRRPTVHAPPVPSEYPCVSLAVYRKAVVCGRFAMQYPPGSLASSAADISLGTNRLIRVDGGWRLVVSGMGVESDLVFRSRFEGGAEELTFRSGERAELEHRWALPEPLCDVEGTLSISGERATFSGRGYHDHRYGTGPIGFRCGRFVYGRAIYGDRVRAFQIFRSPSRRADETLLVEADQSGVRPIAVSGDRGVWKRTIWGLAYPTELRLSEFEGDMPHDRLKWVNGQILESTPFSARIAFAALDRVPPASAICNVIYPRRLQLPFIARVG